MGMNNNPIALTISNTLTKYIREMKQLRKDWLLLYGFIQNNSQPLSIQQNHSASMNYLQLVQLAANHQLHECDQELTIFTVLKYLRFKFSIGELRLIINDQKNEI
eukprot:GHVR01155120.1.p1 GENE.GHVR01155120.1~~GHVR01155120.1.p1  ORF type:complete len:105 (+),score=3.85 GHVR01155120.1:2339-2653(+)